MDKSALTVSERDSVVSDRVLEILKETLTAPPSEGLSVDLELLDIVEDSFEVVEIVFALEEEFDVDIPDNEVRTVQTVGDLVDRLQTLTESRNSPKPGAEHSTS